MDGTRVVIDGWENEPNVSEKVIDAVAAETGRDVAAIGPLYEVIDPSALDALFHSTVRGPARTTGQVRFPFEGYEVTVYARGSITVEPLDE